MDITERQEKILNYLIKEYIDSAEPVSSELLKKRSNLNISPATIRNELQELTQMGYIGQPHTSAGRVPTQKGYNYFIQITFSGKVDRFPEFILKEVADAKQKVDQELQMAKEMAKSLESMHSLLNFNRIEEEMLSDIFRALERSKITYKSNIDMMRKLLREFEDF